MISKQVIVHENVLSDWEKTSFSSWDHKKDKLEKYTKNF